MYLLQESTQPDESSLDLIQYWHPTSHLDASCHPPPLPLEIWNKSRCRIDSLFQNIYEEGPWKRSSTAEMFSNLPSLVVSLSHKALRIRAKGKPIALSSSKGYNWSFTRSHFRVVERNLTCYPDLYCDALWGMRLLGKSYILVRTKGRFWNSLIPWEDFWAPF